MLQAVEHEVESTPTLARDLRDLRLELEHARAPDEDRHARTLFQPLLNDGQAVEAAT